MLRMLEEALDRLDVPIRVESMPEEAHLAGGLCFFRGKYTLYIAPRASSAERLEILLSALRQLDTDSIWLPPIVREMIMSKN